MKHLKRFNEAIDWECVNIIKDILLELEDMDINIYFTGPGMRSEKWTPQFGAYKKARGEYMYEIMGNPICKHFLEWDDIKDCILRLKNYIGGNFISFSYIKYSLPFTGFFQSEPTFIHINNNTKITDKILTFRILFM